MTRTLILALLLLAACGGSPGILQDKQGRYALEIDAMLPSGQPICIEGAIALNGCRRGCTTSRSTSARAAARRCASRCHSEQS
jgi:hypothetical protein